MVFLVSYLLNPSRHNQALVDELQKFPAWSRYLDTTWLIATDEDVTAVYDRLRTKFLSSDLFAILELRAEGQYYGWMPKEYWEWIQRAGEVDWFR